MVAFRSVFAILATALQLTSHAYAQGLFEPSAERRSAGTRTLAARQDAADIDACVQVDISVLGINLASDVCICVDGGVITPASVTRIDTLVRANQGLLAGVINTLGGITNTVTRIVSDITPTVLARGADTTCEYPDNSVPNSCSACTYDCYSDNTVTYVPCGDFCVLQGSACTSGMPGRRALARDSLNRCPSGFEACRIPGAPRTSIGFECVNTSSDLESCGGCATPFAGRPTGQDCSALPNAASTSCVRGQCVVKSCAKGYSLDDNECVLTAGSRLQGYWEGLQEAVKVASA